MKRHVVLINQHVLIILLNVAKVNEKLVKDIFGNIRSKQYDKYNKTKRFRIFL